MSKTIQYKVQVDTGNSVKTLGQLESELAQINDELKGVEVGSDSFKELSQQSQQVTRDLEKANQQIEGFTADKKFQAADGAIKLAAGSLQSFVGGLGLLGIESDALGEFEEKAASAIAVGIGLKDLSEGVGQLAPLFKQSGIAAKLFGTTARTAITATGIGLFVVALGTVVAYWDDIVKGVKNFANSVPFVGKAIESIKNAFNDLIDRFRPVLEFLGILPDEVEIANQAVIESNNQVIDQTQRELELLQAKGASQEEIFNKRKQQLEAELDNLRRNGAEQEEIFEKETELLVLQAKEEKRLADEKDRIRKEQLEKDKKAQEKQERLAEEERQRKEKEKEEEEKRIQEEIERENKRLESIAGILETYRQRQRDIEAESEIEKINLEEERKLAELERLGATEEQKQEIRNFYEDRRREAQLAADELKREEDKKRSEDAIAAAISEKEAIAQIEQAKLGVLSQAGGLLNQLAGENQQLQIASVVATQAAAIGQILSSTAVSNAKAVAASPLTFGQPWVAINSISAGLGIASSIASATKAISDIKASKSKTSPSGGGNLPRGRGGAAGGANTQAEPPVSRTFSSTLEQQVEVDEIRESRREPIQTYVISGDVSNAQEAEQKIRQRRRVGS